jgi:hypothetical protein
MEFQLCPGFFPRKMSKLMQRCGVATHVDQSSRRRHFGKKFNIISVEGHCLAISLHKMKHVAALIGGNCNADTKTTLYNEFKHNLH